MKESHPRRPLSPYGVSKMAAIDYLVAYRELHALEFCALALANVYGPRQDPHGEAGVVAIFSDRLLRGEPVTIFGDGEQTRDFVYVDDVVDAFVRAGARGGGLVLNIGTGVEVSVNELARVMGERAGTTTSRRSTPPARAGEIQRSALDPERAGIHLGWRPWTDARRRRGRRCSSTPGGRRPADPSVAGPGCPSAELGERSAEQVLGGRPEDLLGHRSPSEPGGIDAAHDRHGDRRRPCP